jgi:hypothetical protein
MKMMYVMIPKILKNIKKYVTRELYLLNILF